MDSPEHISHTRPNVQIGFLGPALFLSQLSHITTATGAVACMMASQGLDSFSQSGLYSNHQVCSIGHWPSLLASVLLATAPSVHAQCMFHLLTPAVPRLPQTLHALADLSVYWCCAFRWSITLCHTVGSGVAGHRPQVFGGAAGHEQHSWRAGGRDGHSSHRAHPGQRLLGRCVERGGGAVPGGDSRLERVCHGRADLRLMPQWQSRMACTAQGACLTGIVQATAQPCLRRVLYQQ